MTAVKISTVFEKGVKRNQLAPIPGTTILKSQSFLADGLSPGPARRFCSRGVETWIRINDPSAGSPTETLLRLLLPLNDQV